MTWHGTHPDTEAGKPTTTDPDESPNTASNATNEPTARLRYTTETAPTEATGTPPHIEAPTSPDAPDSTDEATAQPESNTPDTDSASSDGHESTTENSSNTRENTGHSTSEESTDGPKSAAAEHAKVYVVMVDDRHSDPEPYVFSTAEAAIAYARAGALEYAIEPQDFGEHIIKGLLYHATYSPEGDSVWVIEKEVDGEQAITGAGEAGEQA